MSINISTNTVRSGLNTQTNDLRAILEQLPTAISRINAYIEDGALTGAAYTAHKTYLCDGHLPFLRSLQNGLMQFVEANEVHTRVIDAYLSHPHYDQRIIQNTISYLDSSIRELDSLINIYQQHHLIDLRNSRRRMRTSWRERQAQLETYLNHTNSIYDAVETAMQIAVTNLLCLEHAHECPTTGAYVLPTAEEMFIHILEDEITYLVANPERVAQLADARRQEIIDHIAEKYRGQNVTGIPSDKRDLLINCYELNYPINGNKMNNFLKPLATAGLDSDKLNIKFILYTAPVHYQTVVFEYLPEISIIDVNWTGTQHYHSVYSDPARNGDGHPARSMAVNFNSSSGGINDLCGPYFTFFHELGHGIDNAMGGFNGWGSSTLFENIKSDVYENIMAEIVRQTPPPHTGTVKNEMDMILSSLKHGGTSLTDKNLLHISKLVTDKFYVNLSDPIINGVASDVYGGVTNNRVTDAYGHYTKPDYWYDTHGNATGMQNKEFFAGNFAISITGYQDPAESVANYFPTATIEMDNMMQDAANEILGGAP